MESSNFVDLNIKVYQNCKSFFYNYDHTTLNDGNDKLVDYYRIVKVLKLTAGEVMLLISYKGEVTVL
jgi:hypothetical protein